MKPTVWIVDDDRSIRWVMEKALQKTAMTVRCFESAVHLLDALQTDQPDTIVSDIRMPGMDGLEMLQTIHQSTPELPIIITTAHSDLDSAVAAYQGGAFEYLPKPFDIEELIAVTNRAIIFANG